MMLGDVLPLLLQDEARLLSIGFSTGNVSVSMGISDLRIIIFQLFLCLLQ